jgi:hypothetical protein
MSFMLKIALALQLTVVSAVALAGTSTDSKPTATEQDVTSPETDRPSCDACSDGYNSCLSEGISPDACRRAYANCFRNCL